MVVPENSEKTLRGSAITQVRYFDLEDKMERGVPGSLVGMWCVKSAHRIGFA
jgi:hypothetical protein